MNESKLNTDLIKLIIAFIPAGFAQQFIAPLITFNFISPDFIIIPIIYFAVRNGQMFGMLTGFALGFLWDLVSGGILGSSMFVYTLSGFIAGYFFTEDQDKVITHKINFSFVVLLAASISAFLSGIFLHSEIQFNLIILIFKQGIFPGGYTAIFSLIVLLLPNKQYLS